MDKNKNIHFANIFCFISAAYLILFLREFQVYPYIGVVQNSRYILLKK
jgi:hypothetical protein